MPKEIYQYQPRCCDCGRWCRPADSGTYWGTNYEPPDPVYWCRSCTEQRMHTAYADPAAIIVGCWWIKPQYVKVAEARRELREKREILDEGDFRYLDSLGLPEDVYHRVHDSVYIDAVKILPLLPESETRNLIKVMLFGLCYGGTP